MGTSVKVIKLHYGALLDGSRNEIAARLDRLDAARRTYREAIAEDG